ncbi:MFS domain-containing protein [Pycnococcus provasolii]
MSAVLAKTAVKSTLRRAPSTPCASVRCRHTCARGASPAAPSSPPAPMVPRARLTLAHVTRASNANVVPVEGEGEGEDSSESKDEQQPPPVPLRAWLVLACLLACSVTNQWDRALFSYLYAIPTDGLTADAAAFISIGADLQLTTTQYGILSGLAFTVLYATAGLYAGRLADSFDRRALVAGGCFLWSGATALFATVHSFPDALFARTGLGLFESLSAPASFSLIAQYFDDKTRGRANSIFSLGIYLGGALASLSQILAKDTGLGWRGTYAALAVVGCGVAVITLGVVKEPARLTSGGAKDQKDGETTSDESLFGSVKEILKPTAAKVLFLASGVRYMAGYTLGAFLPVYYRTAFPDYGTQFSVYNALIVGGCGLTSALLGGAIADRLAAGGGARSRALVPAFGAFTGAGFLFLALTTDNFVLSMVFLGLEYICAENWFGPTLSLLQGLVPQNRQGTASSLFLFVGAILGSSGPLILGLVLDSLGTAGTAEGIRGGLLAASGGAYLLCSLGFGTLYNVLGNDNDKEKPSSLPS